MIKTNEPQDSVMAQDSDMSQSPISTQPLCSTFSVAQGQLPWECPVCFSEQDTHGWTCPKRHMFCAECMNHHVHALAFPRCPSCDYELVEDDFVLLNVPQERLRAFQNAKLQCAVDKLAIS